VAQEKLTVKMGAFTAVVEKEGDGFVALCPELDVASQGETIEGAVANLREAVELFLECASEDEIKDRLHTAVFVTRFEAAYA
jgi:predicted RNase H-like HicB family nuclease